MKIAVEGCAHGELEKIYECIETLQEREGIQIDLLICCGDFQSVRNGDDLRSMATPEKYQVMCSFYKYYSGERKAPILTIFIGGNHEASNYLQELPYGGWVAPKIYYMGRSGVVRFGNLRIGGMSGIFKGHDYLQGLWECVPYTPNSLRSVYHVRSLDVFRLEQLKEKVHVMLSHDWPRGITDFGNKQRLISKKPFLREDIEADQLGSDPAKKLLHKMRPDYWFAAHLHCQFAALVKHADTGTETKFLALDKCLPKRRHLQVLDLPSEYDGDKQLKYDVEWLAILKNTNHLLTVKNMNSHMPGPGGNERYDFSPTQEEMEAVTTIMGNITIKDEYFVMTAPVYAPDEPIKPPTEPIINPQTEILCEKLGIDDPVQVIMARLGRKMKQPIAVIDNKPNPAEDNSPPVKTPVKCTKLSLPAPVTPSDHVEQTSQNLLIPDNTSSISASDNDLSEFGTPVLTGVKKTFKRRNVSIYNTPCVDDTLSTTASSILESEDSPCSSKLSCKGNP